MSHSRVNVAAWAELMDTLAKEHSLKTMEDNPELPTAIRSLINNFADAVAKAHEKIQLEGDWDTFQGEQSWELLSFLNNSTDEIKLALIEEYHQREPEITPNAQIIRDIIIQCRLRLFVIKEYFSSPSIQQIPAMQHLTAMPIDDCCMPNGWTTFQMAVLTSSLKRSKNCT